MAGLLFRTIDARIPRFAEFRAGLPEIRARYEAKQAESGLTDATVAVHLTALRDWQQYDAAKRLSTDRRRQAEFDRLPAPQRSAIRAYVMGYESSPERQARAAEARPIAQQVVSYEERRKYLTNKYPSYDDARLAAWLDAKRARSWVENMPVVAYRDRQCMEQPSSPVHKIIVFTGLDVVDANAYCQPVFGERGEIIRQRGWLLNVPALPADVQASLAATAWAMTPWDPTYMVRYGD